jgi:hypothetical protein
MAYVIGLHQGDADLQYVGSDVPITYAAQVSGALHFTTAAVATAWLAARGITAVATAYLRPSSPSMPPTSGPSHYLIQATAAPGIVVLT